MYEKYFAKPGDREFPQDLPGVASGARRPILYLDKENIPETSFTFECSWLMAPFEEASLMANENDAMLFMNGDDNRLTLRTRGEGKDVRVTISNNGEDIAPKDLPFIFERFYKADKAHTSGQGTGLGLSICQRIVKQHGSVITCASGNGQTSFTFTLPAAEAPKALPPTEE